MTLSSRWCAGICGSASVAGIWPPLPPSWALPWRHRRFCGGSFGTRASSSAGGHGSSWSKQSHVPFVLEVPGYSNRDLCAFYRRKERARLGRSLTALDLSSRKVLANIRLLPTIKQCEKPIRGLFRAVNSEYIQNTQQNTTAAAMRSFRNGSRLGLGRALFCASIPQLRTRTYGELSCTQHATTCKERRALPEGLEDSALKIDKCSDGGSISRPKARPPKRARLSP